MSKGNYLVGIIVELSIGIAVIYGLVAVGFFVFQRKILYRPDPARHSPLDMGLAGVEEIEMTTSDGEMLIAWYAKPRDPSLPVIMYFHGNAGNIASRRDRVRRITGHGYGIFMLSYRGYGGSTGSPSEFNFHADAAFAYDTLRAAIGISADRIVLYGESLGTGVATRLATRRNVAAVVLEAPFTSTTAVAKKRFPYLPMDSYLKDKYENINRIEGINAPLLVIHGALDDVIPLEFGQELFQVANEPKQFVIIPNAGHSHMFRHGAFGHVREFLDQYVNKHDTKVTDNITMLRYGTSSLLHISASC